MIGASRADFDVPDDIAFLNTANIGPRLHVVRGAERRALDRWAEPWRLTADDWFRDTERLRALAALCFLATADDVAIIPSVSYAMAVAVKNVGCGPGQNVVVLDEEFPSNYYAWATRANETGAALRTARRGEDGTWTDSVLAEIDSATAVVAVPVCHWTDGTLIGIESVARRAREVGAALVIDASQSAGVLSLDVRALDPDFVVTVGYKWLLGPFGLSYLYVAPRHHGGVSIEDAWPMRRGSENLSRLTEYVGEYRDGARRFDAGEHQNFILLPMAIAALEYVTRQQDAAENIARLRTLTGELATIGSAYGLSTGLDQDRVPHLLGLTAGAERAVALTGALASRNVFVSARGDRVRIAPYLHTTATDIRRFADALASAEANDDQRSPGRSTDTWQEGGSPNIRRPPS